jgi:hypothetical protein
MKTDNGPKRAVVKGLTQEEAETLAKELILNNRAAFAVPMSEFLFTLQAK